MPDGGDQCACADTFTQDEKNSVCTCGGFVSVDGTTCGSTCTSGIYQTDGSYNTCVEQCSEKRFVHVEPDITECLSACPSAAFVEEDNVCKCGANTRLTPDEANCVSALEYTEPIADGKKFWCKEGLIYADGECKPGDGKTWADLQAICNGEGKVVSLDGSRCIAACDTGETNSSGRCACGLVDGTQYYLNLVGTKCVTKCDEK